MGNPFTSAAIANYNANPPADDGTQVTANQVKWSTIKTKLDDPIKTLAETDVTNTNAAFAKIIGGGGITTTAISYTIISEDQGKWVKATASGVTITTPDATSVGSPFVCIVVNESSADITLAGNNPGVQQTVDGANTVTIPAGAGVILNTDGTNWFTGGQNFTKTQIAPQGYLTLVSGTPVITSDQTAKTAVYYTPDKGDLIPIPNGTSFNVKEFTELTLTLASQHTANNLFDVFVFLDPSDNSTVRIGTGPAWTTATAGSCARGTGAGTTELARLKGLYVNNVSATMRNGATTYSVGAKSAVYVGSLFIDGTNGQISCHTSYGQSRKWGVWNAYNRRQIILKCGDGTASWTYSTGTYRPSNNSTNNSITVFEGLAEDNIAVSFRQHISQNTAGGFVNNIAIGFNSTSSVSGYLGSLIAGSAANSIELSIPAAVYTSPGLLGINNFTSLEYGNSNVTVTWYGTENKMLLQANYQG